MSPVAFEGIRTEASGLKKYSDWMLGTDFFGKGFFQPTHSYIRPEQKSMFTHLSNFPRLAVISLSDLSFRPAEGSLEERV